MRDRRIIIKLMGKGKKPYCCDYIIVLASFPREMSDSDLKWRQCALTGERPEHNRTERQQTRHRKPRSLCPRYY